MKIFGILLFSVFILSCNNRDKAKIKFCKDLSIELKTDLFNPEADFTIINIAKADGYLDMEDLLMCTDWKLDEKELYQIVRNSHFVREEVWNTCLEHLRCKMTARLVQQQDTFELGVNAGAWFYLRNADTTLRFAAIHPDNKELFLSKKMFKD